MKPRQTAEREVYFFMMLYPAMGELSAQIHNRYMLVNVVARRARQIAEAYEEANQKLDDKPVTIAINEVANGVLDDPEQMPPKSEEEPELSDEPDADTDLDEEAGEASDDEESAEPEASEETE